MTKRDPWLFEGILGGSSQLVSLVTLIYEPFRPFIRGITPCGGLTITMVINHLLTGMILQVGDEKNCPVIYLGIKTLVGWVIWGIDYTTQLCGDYFISHEIRIPSLNQLVY